VPRLARHRFIVAVLACALAAVPAAAFAPAPTRAATSFKLALIVGPMGSDTSGNRSRADQIATQAAAMGVTVAKAYSPNATYAKVRAAVSGANVVVYFGHGNGYPNPYGNNLLTDRVDGWGLNTSTTNGDADSWSAGTMVYCGEKALEGKLTSTDGAAQRTYCSAGAIQPAPGFVMVYVGSCYTAGSNEPQNPEASSSDAVAHAAYYSRPMLTTLGASGYFAGRTEGVVLDLLANPDKSYGDIWNEDMPSGIDAAYDMPHPLVSGLREWLTHQATNPWWYYAFAGNPARTLDGGTSTYTAPTSALDSTPPHMTAHSPGAGQTGVSPFAKVSVTFSEAVTGVSSTTLTLWKGSTQAAATVSYDSSTRTATLTPASSLSLGATYVVKVSSSIRDTSGNRYVASSWWFSVAKSASFSPARHVNLAVGSHTGYRFSSTGAVLGSKTRTLSSAASPTVSKESLFSGRSGVWLYVTSGTWSGYWMQATSTQRLV
jgi:hypothetical protein